MNPTVDAFISRLATQVGKPYVFGAEVDMNDPSPPAFDCAEFFEWGTTQIGLVPPLPDGTWLQIRYCAAHGTLLPVATAQKTRGALLFKFSADPFVGPRPPQAHVALSLGDGRTLESRSTQHGTGYFETQGRGWTHAALVPGLDYGAGNATGGGLFLVALAALYWLTR